MGRGIGHRPAGGDPRRLDRLAEISRAGLDIAHPDPKSLSHSVAAQLGEGVSRSGHSIEIANLAAEGFDPRFTAIDLAVHRREVPPPADAAEQARIDRADALVLVYPVYWWSMPGC